MQSVHIVFVGEAWNVHDEQLRAAFAHLAAADHEADAAGTDRIIGLRQREMIQL